MAADPVTLGAATRIVYGLASAAGLASGGDTKKQLARQQAAVELGGYVRTGRGYTTPEGKRVSIREARQYGAQLLAGAVAIPQPGFPQGGSLPGVPGSAGGPSVADRIPGRVAAPVAGGALLARLIGWGAGLLFYPREAGRGSELCTKTKWGLVCPPVVTAQAAPVPSPGPRRRGRVRPPPTAAPSRRRERPRTGAAPVPVSVPRPGARPVTISRARVESVPPAVAVSTPAPRPSAPPVIVSQPAPTIRPGEMSYPVPATIPAARTAPTTSSAPVAKTIAQAAAAIGLPAVLMRSASQSQTRSQTQTGTLTSSPPLMAPLAAPAQALTESQARGVASPQTLDDLCRARARARERNRKKRKRKERTVCYRGTFYETKTGTRKYRKEKIPCQSFSAKSR